MQRFTGPIFGTYRRSIKISISLGSRGRKEGRRPLTMNERTEVWEGGKGHLRQNQSSVAPTRAGPGLGRDAGQEKGEKYQETK